MHVSTVEQYDSKIRAAKVAAVKFYAPWCGACQRFEPEWEAIKAKYGSRVTFIEVNVDEARALAGQYVQMLPTVLFYVKNKRQKEKTVVGGNRVEVERMLSGLLRE